MAAQTTGTQALDVVTILHCLQVLEETYLGKNRQWQTRNEEQVRVFEWYEKYKELLQRITGLDAKASLDWRELNEFLVSKGFCPIFEPFEGIGVASVLDKMVKWYTGTAKLVDIHAQNGKTYPGFELPEGCVRVYKTAKGLLAELMTQSDDTLWLLLPNAGVQPAGLDMVQLAIDVMAGLDEDDIQFYDSAKIPMLDFNVKPDIKFMLGANTYDKNNDWWYIAQAFQQFRMRMDETGARVKVATGMVMLRGIMPVENKVIFDRPFYGWWTQKYLKQLPMAVFYADYDSWHKPEGFLESM